MMVCWKSICACLTCFTNILSGNENKTNVFSSWAGWGNEMKMKFNFFWKMIPIKNIIVISIIWLAWAITASFYSTHANVSHVPTPPPPPPTPGVLGRVVRRSQAFPLKQCQENVQINSDVDIWTYSWKLSILELSRNKLIHFSWGRETIGSTRVFIPFSISSY